MMVLRLDEDGLVRMLSARATRRDERFLALMRLGRGESVPQAARAFGTQPLKRKHVDRKRLARSRDIYYRRWS
jgi:hypothetical protein